MHLDGQGNPYPGFKDTRKHKHPKFKKRTPGDISDKVSWGAGASLIVAGLLAWAKEATGIPVPEGLDLYLVALIYAGVAYVKKERE